MLEDREWLGAIPARLLSGAPEPPAGGRFNAGKSSTSPSSAFLVCILYITGVDTIVAGTTTI